MWHRRKKPSAHPEVAEASSSVPHHSKGMFISSVFKNMFKNPSASGDGERSFGKKMDRGTRGMVSQDSQRSMASFHSTRRNKPVALQVDECWVCGLEKAVDGSCACMSDSAPLAHVAPPMDTVAPPPVKIDGLAFTKEIPASPPTIFTPSSFVPRKSMSDSAPPSPQPSPKSSLSIEKRFETQVVALQSVFSKIKQTQKAKKETLLKNHLEKTLSGQGQRAASSDVRFGRDRSQRYQAKGDTTPMSYRPIYLEKSTSPVISARSMTTAPAFAVEPPAMSPRSPSEYLDTSKRGQDRSSKRFPLLIGLRAPSLRSDRDEKTPSVSGPASPRPSFSNPFHSLYNRPSRDIQRSPSCATPTTPTILQQKMRSPTRKFWPNGGKDLMVSESSAHLSAVTDPKPLVYEASQKALPPTPAPAPRLTQTISTFYEAPFKSLPSTPASSTLDEAVLRPDAVQYLYSPNSRPPSMAELFPPDDRVSLVDSGYSRTLASKHSFGTFKSSRSSGTPVQNPLQPQISNRGASLPQVDGSSSKRSSIVVVDLNRDTYSSTGVISSDKTVGDLNSVAHTSFLNESSSLEDFIGKLREIW